MVTNQNNKNIKFEKNFTQKNYLAKNTPETMKKRQESMLRKRKKEINKKIKIHKMLPK